MKSLISLFLLFICFSLFSQTETKEIPETPQELVLDYYYEYEDAIMGQTISEAEADVRYHDVMNLLYTYIEPEEKRLFYEARATYFRGMMSLQDFMLQSMRKGTVEDTQETASLELPEELVITSLMYFNKALDLCEQSLRINPTADAYMAKGLLDLFINMYKGRVHAFFAAFRFLDSAKKAAKFDPDNFEAALMLASTKAIPPAPFGNPKKGLEDLQNLLRKVDSETPKIDLFILYLCFTQVYSNLNNQEMSFFWLNMAQSVYPQNESLYLLEERMRDEKRKSE